MEQELKNCLKTLQYFCTPITHSVKFYMKLYNFTRNFTTLHEFAIHKNSTFTRITSSCHGRNSMDLYAIKKVMRALETRNPALSFTLKIVRIGFELNPNDDREKLCKTKSDEKLDFYSRHCTSETAPFETNETLIDRY